MVRVCVHRVSVGRGSPSKGAIAIRAQKLGRTSVSCHFKIVSINNVICNYSCTICRASDFTAMVRVNVGCASFQLVIVEVGKVSVYLSVSEGRAFA